MKGSKPTRQGRIIDYVTDSERAARRTKIPGMDVHSNYQGIGYCTRIR